MSALVSQDPAYALLGLNGPVEVEALTRAFRVAVKSAHPDRPGGDAERFRRVVAAHRLIQAGVLAPSPLSAPRLCPTPPPVVALTPRQALGGGRVAVRIGGRRLRITAPPGMRTGERLRLRRAAEDGGDLLLQVLIRPGDGLRVLGDDLHMTWPVSPRLLEDGGRVEIDTHAGPQSAWVTGGLTSPVRLRLRGLGLPARDPHAAGHLFVTLAPCAEAPSAAEALLARFSSVWTPEPLAA